MRPAPWRITALDLLRLALAARSASEESAAAPVAVVAVAVGALREVSLPAELPLPVSARLEVHAISLALT